MTPALVLPSLAVLLAACVVGCASSDENGHADTASALSCPQEICDGVDNDCDAQVDEDASDAPYWYRDADADGFGDPSVVTRSCQQPSGYVSDASDCDDANSSVNPLGAETCNGLDDDCNGLADDEDPNVTGGATWYSDPDADGYGSEDATVQACQRPEGYAALAGDCDQEDPSIHPGATETWYDGVDSDCDGANDYDADGDGYVSAEYSDEAGKSDDDGDGYDAGDCDDGDALINPGAFEYNDGLDNNCDGDVDFVSLSSESSENLEFTGESYGSNAGYSMAGNGDVNGDGELDVLIGAPGEATNGDGAGAAYLLLGPLTADMSLAEADAKLLGEQEGDHAGHRVALPGDVDGDGIGDILVSADDADAGWTDNGAVYLLSGPVSGSMDLGSATARLEGEYNWDSAGFSLAGAGDVNADGYRDILLGATSHDSNGLSNNGASYLLLGPVSGELDLSVADAAIYGRETDDYNGADVQGVGDLNADGYDDIAVGQYEDGGSGDIAGAYYVFFGPVSGNPTPSQADATLHGWDQGVVVAGSLSVSLDFDEDGYQDLVGGDACTSYAQCEAGAIYFIAGPITGSYYPNDLEIHFTGEASGDKAGCSVASVGDVNGDSHPDVIVGASGQDTGGSSAGATYLLLGTFPSSGLLADADAIFRGGAAGDYLGYAVASAGDVDHDGYDDFLTSAYGDDQGSSGAGAVHLIFGGPEH